jgi:hypothetical protein
VPKTPVAVITQHSTNLAGLMVVIYNQRALISTDNAFLCFCLDLLQLFVADGVAKLATTNFIPVSCTAGTAPTIQPVPLLVMRREKLCGAGFPRLTTSTGQQFHAFKDKAFLVGLPFSSFIGPGIPDILAQNDRRLAASFSVFGCGAGGFNPGLPGLARL